MDLRDFAEKLYVSGTAQEAEFAKEILDNLDEVERTAGYGEILDTINRAMPDKLKGEHWRQLEYLEDRSERLEEIEGGIIPGYAGRLKMAGIECTDTDDIIRALLDRLPTEWGL